MVYESEIRQSDWLLTRRRQLMLVAESADILRVIPRVFKLGTSFVLFITLLFDEILGKWKSFEKFQDHTAVT